MDRPEAGWYPDPEQPGQARYFDGTGWTDHVRDAAPTTPTEDGLPAGDDPQAASDHRAGEFEHGGVGDRTEVPATEASSQAALPPTGRATSGSREPAATAGQTAVTDRGGSGNRGMVLTVSVVLMLVVLAGSFFFSGMLDGATDDGDDAADDAAETDEVDLEGLLDELEAERDAAASDEADDVTADDDGAATDAGDDAEDDDAVAQEGPASPDTSDIDPYELVIDPDADYLATITTSEGDIVLELDAAGAPVTVNNLVRLARAGYYDGVIFHRVIEDFVLQGGDPTGTGTGGPGYRFEDELGPAEVLVEAEGGYPRGTLAMANAGPDTNGSQFFIVHGELVELPPAYTVFGEVVDGMDVVDTIATVATSAADRPETDIVIESIEITGP